MSAATTAASTQAADASIETETCDVLVVGGGPGGATVAALLAEQGRQVVLLEKAEHPRFHIGESLLPANVPLFERLGLREELDRIGMPKWGIEFVSPDHAHRCYLEFAEAWETRQPSAWQVRRSEMDELLFRNAARRGARTLERCQVRQVAIDADGVTVEADWTPASPDGRPAAPQRRRWRARFVVDASGRDTLLANQFDLKRKNPRHNSAAIFGHFRHDRRLEGKREGNISIFWFRHGWWWVIPLADGTTSVGAVCWPHYLKSRDKPLKDFFMDTVAMTPALAERLRDAELVDDKVHATGNYSYTSTRCTGERHLMVGDAYAFIDPVFSSGVYLAMHSAFRAAEVVATCLDRPAEAARAMRGYEAMMRRGPAEFSWFIHRVTNPGMRELFMHPRNVLRVKEAVLAVLAGDIFGRRPYRASLWVFKLIYTVTALGHLPRTLRAWRARRHNVRDLGPLQGETVMEPR
jgi:flavin-dependent dehydrogenase